MSWQRSSSDTGSTRLTINEFFSGAKESREIYDALQSAIKALGPVEIQVTKSQISFRRAKPFAWAWRPGKYLRLGHAPLVLSLVFIRRDVSPRWKEIVEPAPGRFMHHLELNSEADIDDEVRGWIQEARQAAE